MRILKQFTAIVVICLCGLQQSYAQKFAEIGFGIGNFQYQGDLTKNAPVIEEFAFSGSIFYRYNFNSAFAAKVQASFGRISGDDMNANFHQRNTEFKSLLGELAITGQVDIIALIQGDEGLKKVSPFIYAGVAGFYFNPQGKFEGKWYDLQPLGTEGQGLAQYPDKKEYSLIQVSIPFGVDIRYNLSRRAFTGFEFGMRKTFTDYLDDVSGTYADNAVILAERGEAAAYLADPTVRDVKFPEGAARGNSKKMDWYSHFNIYFTYNLIGKRDWRYMRNKRF